MTLFPTFQSLPPLLSFLWPLTMLLVTSWTFKSCSLCLGLTMPKERPWGTDYASITVRKEKPQDTSMLSWCTIPFSSLCLGKTSYYKPQTMFPSHLLAIHLNLWDDGFPLCPLGGEEHQESSVQNLTMRDRQTSLTLITVISSFIPGTCYSSWKFSAITPFLSVIAVSIFTSASNIAWGHILIDTVLDWYMIPDLRHLWSQKTFHEL